MEGMDGLGNRLSTAAEMHRPYAPPRGGRDGWGASAQSPTAPGHIDALRKPTAADFMVKLYQMLSHENKQLIAWQDGERRAA